MIEVVHLLVILVAIGLVGRLAKESKQKPEPALAAPRHTVVEDNNILLTTSAKRS